MKRILRVGVAIVLLAAAWASTLAWTQAQTSQAQTSQAQIWPQRPVRFILPLGPGAGVDIAARLLGERLAARWGQSVVIENRPGGDGIVALTAFTGAQDDHTLLMAPTSSFTHHPCDRAIVTRLAATGQVVNPGTAAELGAAIDVQRIQAAAVGRLLGIKPAQ